MIIAKVILKNEMFEYVVLKSHEEFYKFLEDLREWYKETDGEEGPISYLEVKYNTSVLPYTVVANFKDLEKYLENNAVFKIVNVEEI